MKIAICTSFSFIKETVAIKDQLEKMGHIVFIPHNAELYANGTLAPETRKESTQNKIAGNLIARYYNIINDCDAILVVNKDKYDFKNYIGGNTFLEMGFAHVLNKKIFLLNAVPEEMLYSDEILAMPHIIINNDLNKIA